MTDFDWRHYCLDCGHGWEDNSRYYNCPWCGGCVTNARPDEDEDEDE